MAAEQTPSTSRGPSDEALVLSSLERDQLAAFVRRQRVPRRKLSRVQVAVLWSLRLYLLFMMAVVIHQIWKGGK